MTILEKTIEQNVEIVPVDLFTVPNNIQFTDFGYQTIETDNKCFSLRFPKVQPNDILQMITTISENRKKFLSQLKVSEIIELIDRAIQCWTDPNYPQRQLAEKLLPEITGYNAETIRLEIKRYVRVFRKKELQRFVDTELDQPEILDDFHPQKSGSMTKAFGPKTIFQVFSGNIPGLQIWPLIMGLLVKSANLGKTSMAEPLFPILFAQTLTEVSPELGNCIAILPWKGGTRPLEKAAVNHTDATIAYGSDNAVKSIRSLVPMSKTFLQYGYKISFSMIGREALTPDHYAKTIKQAVEDVAVYDQQSCLSPQTIFIEDGGHLSPLAAAKLIASELANYQIKRPRAALTDNEAASIVRLRNQYAIQALNDNQIQLFNSSGNTDWTVVYHEQPGFESSPLNRSIHIFKVHHLEDVSNYLAPYQKYLQSCGLATAPNRLFDLADRLGQVGVDRICALGEMTRAKPGWHHDGHFNLLDLLHFVDIEQNTEMASEQLDPDVE